MLSRREFLKAAWWTLSLGPGLALSGCAGLSLEGAAPAPDPPGPPPTPAVGAFAARAQSPAPAGDVTLNLNPGWNAIGFQVQQITAISAPPAAAGLTFWDGSAYPLRQLTPAAINGEGDGTRRGFWIFATAATSLSYSGLNDGQSNFVNLRSGWNLVAFPGNAPLQGSVLTATQNGQSVPVGSVVLPLFTEIQPDNSYLSVNIQQGGELRPGRAYWVFASAAVRLSWPGGGPTQEPGVEVSGTVVRADFGSGSFVVQTAHRERAEVGSDGAFKTRVQDSSCQLVFLHQAGGLSAQAFDFSLLRGLALQIKGVSLTVSAESTALSMIFMTFGILTLNETEAVQRVARIRALPTFTSLVAFLKSRLATDSLAALGRDPQLESLKSQLVTEFFSPTVASRLSQGEFDALLGQGLCRGKTVTGGTDLENHGFRFVSVIRRELLASGQEVVAPVRPSLIPGARNLCSNDLPGGNNVSYGNWWTSSLLEATPYRDPFTPNARTEKVEYWVAGPGRGGDLLPPSIVGSDFSDSAHYLTAFFYFFLPLVDLVTGGIAGLTAFRSANVKNVVEVLDASLFPALSLGGSASGLSAAYEGNDAGNIKGAQIDVLAALTQAVVSFGATIAAAVLADGAAITVSAALFGAGLVIVAGLMALTSLAFAMLNFSLAIKHTLTLPAVARVPVSPAAGGYVFIQAPDANPAYEFVGVAVNALGESLALVNHTTDTQGTLLGRGTSGELSPAFSPNGPKNGPTSGYPCLLNRQGDRAWLGEAGGFPDQIYFQRQGGPPVNPIGTSLRHRLYGLLDRDANGRAFLFGDRVSDTESDVFVYTEATGVSPLNLSSKGLPPGYVYAMEVNETGLALLIWHTPERWHLVRYQYPLSATSESLEILFSFPITKWDGIFDRRALYGVAVNARGDYAYLEHNLIDEANRIVILEVVIKRVGQAEVRHRLERGVVDLRINVTGDVFVSEAEGQGIEKFPAGGGARSYLDLPVGVVPNYLGVGGNFLIAAGANTLAIIENP